MRAQTRNANRPIATMPRFTISPENSAEIAPGAAVCASGSQPWNGTSPAFVAKPATSRAERDHVGGRGRAGQGVVQLPEVERAVTRVEHAPRR